MMFINQSMYGIKIWTEPTLVDLFRKCSLWCILNIEEKNL